MAAQRGVLLQEKVNRLVSGQNGKRVLKPNNPLVLKDHVASRKPKKGEATCITEMSVLMACWKQNNFVEDLCSSEMRSFYACVDVARDFMITLDAIGGRFVPRLIMKPGIEAMKNKSGQTNLQGGRLHPKQATALLKRFPNIRAEI